MLIFLHLLAGLAIGFILALIFKNRFAILFAGFGAILPDLIDKPLGYLLFTDITGFGRIYAHSLLFIAALALLGLGLYLFNRKKIAVLCVAVGALSHQLLDSMWGRLNVWLWPFNGSIFKTDVLQKFLETHTIIIIVLAILTVVFIAIYVVLAKRNASPVKKMFVAAGFLIGEFAVFYLMKRVLLGMSADLSEGGYIVVMFFREITSYSEWIAGIASLLVLIDILFIIDSIGKTSNGREKIIFGKPFKLSFIAGVFAVVMGIVGVLLLLLGLSTESGYGVSTGLFVAMVLSIAGVIILVLSRLKRVKELDS